MRDFFLQNTHCDSDLRKSLVLKCFLANKKAVVDGIRRMRVELAGCKKNGNEIIIVFLYVNMKYFEILMTQRKYPQRGYIIHPLKICSSFCPFKGAVRERCVRELLSHLNNI